MPYCDAQQFRVHTQREAIIVNNIYELVFKDLDALHTTSTSLLQHVLEISWNEATVRRFPPGFSNMSANHSVYAKFTPCTSELDNSVTESIGCIEDILQATRNSISNTCCERTPIPSGNNVTCSSGFVQVCDMKHALHPLLKGFLPPLQSTFHRVQISAYLREPPSSPLYSLPSYPKLT